MRKMEVGTGGSFGRGRWLTQPWGLRAGSWMQPAALLLFSRVGVSARTATSASSTRPARSSGGLARSCGRSHGRPAT
jgi:hypothetical protein